MKRFIKYFSTRGGDRTTANLINEYAEKNNLKIIALTTAHIYGIYVLFEESEDAE